ncbi:hypothetical protein GCM10023094_41550 [Rhodococcus olei]|uniref:Uncharacterized protein n=1 Tax=Rhodococcus olei TaxID=2161675 RepID=A0ABP8PE70_9NOCA
MGATDARLWITRISRIAVGGCGYDPGRAVANDRGSEGQERPHTGRLDLIAPMVRFGGPPLDGTKKSSPNHLSCQPKCGQDPAGAFEDGDRNAGLVGKTFPRGRDAAPGAVIRDARHRYSDSVNALRVDAVLLALLYAAF